MSKRQSAYQALVITSLMHVRGSRCLGEAVQHGDRYAVRYGPMTHEVAIAEGKSACIVRYHLKRLQTAGHVISSPCAGGTTRWWPSGFCDDLKACQTVEDDRTYFATPPMREVA